MYDPRLEKLADILINYSTRLAAGEKVLIDIVGVETPLACLLVKMTYRAGALPFVSIRSNEVFREILLGGTEEQIDLMAAHALRQMKDMDAYIGVRAGENTNELADVPEAKMRLFNMHYTKPVHLEQRVPHTKWCVLRYPNYSMAQQAGMSTEAFEDFYFRVCCLDYAGMNRAMDALVRRLERADRVRIVGAGTDLEFSVKGIPAVKCAGEMNIPDGEVFTAPVRDSVNGVISCNAPSQYQGFTFENIRLECREGRIVKAVANDTERINGILDSDEGARFFGEFAFGVNPHIMKPMKDTLFDEKISGSIHLTPGSCYDDAPNGNSSAIHWDLVLIQRPEFGGGEIWFDGELIRRDGAFVPEDLQPLDRIE
ncbi:MAG: aminopeptidase [bacterium]|jgi:aminopeptidase